MSLIDKTLKAQLAKYSKVDIINALCEDFDADHRISLLLTKLKSANMRRAIDKEQEAFDAESKAHDAYEDWIKGVIARYGDGNRVDLMKLPQKELEKGARLIEELQKKRHAVEAAMHKANRTLIDDSRLQRRKEREP